MRGQRNSTPLRLVPGPTVPPKNKYGIHPQGPTGSAGGWQLVGAGPRPIPLSFIGSGGFAKAYRGADGWVYLFVDDDDISREALVLAHQRAPHNPHLPAIKRLGVLDMAPSNVAGPRVYREPHYRIAWDVFKALRPQLGGWKQLRQHTLRKRYMQLGRGGPADPMILPPGVPRQLRGALWQLADAAEETDSHVDWVWDFGAENVGFDNVGRVVLLDVLVDGELVGAGSGSTDPSDAEQWA